MLLDSIDCYLKVETITTTSPSTLLVSPMARANPTSGDVGPSSPGVPARTMGCPSLSISNQQGGVALLNAHEKNGGAQVRGKQEHLGGGSDGRVSGGRASFARRTQGEHHRAGDGYRSVGTAIAHFPTAVASNKAKAREQAPRRREQRKAQEVARPMRAFGPGF